MKALATDFLWPKGNPQALVGCPYLRGKPYTLSGIVSGSEGTRPIKCISEWPIKTPLYVCVRGKGHLCIEICAQACVQHLA